MKVNKYDVLDGVTSGEFDESRTEGVIASHLLDAWDDICKTLGIEHKRNRKYLLSNLLSYVPHRVSIEDLDSGLEHIIMPTNQTAFKERCDYVYQNLGIPMDRRIYDYAKWAASVYCHLENLQGGVTKFTDWVRSEARDIAYAIPDTYVREMRNKSMSVSDLKHVVNCYLYGHDTYFIGAGPTGITPTMDDWIPKSDLRTLADKPKQYLEVLSYGFHYCNLKTKKELLVLLQLYHTCQGKAGASILFRHKSHVMFRDMISGYLRTPLQTSKDLTTLINTLTDRLVNKMVNLNLETAGDRTDVSNNDCRKEAIRLVIDEMNERGK